MGENQYDNSKISLNTPLSLHHHYTVESFINAYILIKVGSRVDIEQIRQKLLSIRQVILVHLLIGPTDLIAYVEASSLGELREVLDDSMRVLIDDGSIIETTTELILQESAGRGYSKKNNMTKYSAWLLISLSMGTPEIILKKILSSSIVSNAHAVLGEYDIIVLIESHTIDKIINFIDVEIRSINKIKRVDTRFVLMDVDK